MVGPAADSFSYTVGKLDAGMAILLGEKGQLIEFPSLLLPPGARAGSIVTIAVHRNKAEEKKRDEEFWTLQDDIMEAYGKEMPQPPNLQLRHITQTSVTLEWPPLELATAKIRSLDIYKNGERLAAIPSPLQNTSTKLSGLDLDNSYAFQLVLRTSAGMHPSNVVRVQTHDMANTSGISVCFGNVQDPVLLDNAKAALREMGGKWSDKIQIDTTHFVCTTPAVTPSGAAASGAMANAPGVEYQRALQLSIPIVQPQWLLACHSEKRMIPIVQYYLGTNPSPTHAARPMSISGSSPIARSPPGGRSANRNSMPAPSRGTPPPQQKQARFEPTPEEPGEADADAQAQAMAAAGHKRTGTMKKNFKFPPSPPPGEEAPPVPPVPSITTTPPSADAASALGAANSSANIQEDDAEPVSVVAPSAVEVPPPPPVDKSAPRPEEGEEDLGETEEISLN